MEEIINFLVFDGYGQFIWSAYGLSALVLIGLLLQSLRFQARTAATLANIQGDPELSDEESYDNETEA